MAIVDLIKIPPVQAFLMDGSVMTVFEAILEKFALPKERAIELLDLTDAVLDGAIELKDVPAMLMQAFGVEGERATRMACDIVGYRLLPLEQYVPGVAAQLGTWGADMSKYPKSRVGKMKMVPETFATDLDTKLSLNFSEVLIKRAGYLIGAYWNGEKTKESTLTFFSRASTIGGLGLTPEQAQALLAEVESNRDLVDLLPVNPGERPPAIENSGEAAVKEIEEEFAKEAMTISPSHEITSELPIVNAPTKTPPPYQGGGRGEVREVSGSKDVSNTDPDLADAARAARQSRAIAAPANEGLAPAVAKAVADAQSIIVKGVIAEATLTDLVTKMLKGVRTVYQTREVLARNWKVVGDDLEALTEILERAHDAMHAQKPAALSSEAPVGQSVTNDAVLDTRFTALAQRAPGTHAEETMPGARVSLARTVDEERAQQTAAVSKEKLVDAAVASRPAPVTPMLTVGSVAPKQRDGIMTDVQPVKRLIGPVDELAGMTPAEFRRLSTVPADAVQKIEDILATLQQQSYEDRIRGVMAWRKSPMNQLYVAMTTTALTQGIAVAEVATKRRSAGEESLSPAEIRAISGLNEKLRY